jgi:hypothetical protein
LSKKIYFKTYHVGYRWKGLDFEIVNHPFILEVYEFKIKRTRKMLNWLIFDKFILSDDSESKKKCNIEQNFQVHGGKLFNSIPKNLRNTAGNNVDEFKE